MAAYGMTKAAGLIAATKFAAQLKDEGFVVVTLSPGLVDVSSTLSDAGGLFRAFIDVVIMELMSSDR